MRLRCNNPDCPRKKDEVPLFVRPIEGLMKMDELGNFVGDVGIPYAELPRARCYYCNEPGHLGED